MRRWLLPTLTTGLTAILGVIIIVGHLDLCQARRKCKNTVVNPNVSVSHSSCKIVNEYYLHSYQEVKDLNLSSTSSDTMIFGVTSTQMIPILQEKNAVANKTAIWSDDYLSVMVYLSLEVISGAVSLAIENFCCRSSKIHHSFR